MKYIKLSLLLTVQLFIIKPAFAQDSLLISLATKNMRLFTFDNKNFNGEGWEFIKKEASESSNVLIGEDHFSNEIPMITKAIAASVKFDNFIIEVDPYTTEIIEHSIKQFTEKEKREFYSEYKDLFSFYALKPEFDLLENIVTSKTNLIGSDQIVAYGDQVVFFELLNKTNNVDAKEIYKNIISQSKVYLDAFLVNPQNPLYFLTDEFSNQITNLETFKLSSYENSVIDAVKKSIKIYKEGGHKMRIQLLKHYLMEDFQKWSHSKNLYKYGAMHMARGESFLKVYDLGNLVSNIAESNFEKSFHIMIIGESGMLGSPFRSLPSSKVDIQQWPLKSLKPFFDITINKDWYVFDLRPIREAILSGDLTINDILLERIIKGYDSLVIIPEVTPAEF